VSDGSDKQPHTALPHHTRLCRMFSRMSNDDDSLANANSYPTKDVTPSLKSCSASINPAQDSDKSSGVNSVRPKQAVKHLGYCKPEDEEGLKSYVFAPGLTFEYHDYKPQSGYTELPQPDFWQLLCAVKKIRETPQANGSTDKIVASCDRFLELYTEPHHLPSKEEYMASL
jgi:hypothetical protein